MDSLIKEQVNLKDLCTLKIGGYAKYFAIIKTEKEIIQAARWAKENKADIFVLGGGSNIVFTNDLNKLVLKIEIPGFEIIHEDKNSTTIKIGSGEIWDKVVERTVNLNLSGIESLSLIPGTAGATPVQNVGAYGQEIADTLIELYAFDLEKEEFVTLSKEQCEFTYRNSIFKRQERKRYIITSVTLKLLKELKKIPEYPALLDYLQKNNIESPSLQQIRQAVIAIRSSKLPDPKVIPNVGSFFENPIIPIEKYNELKEMYQDIPGYKVSDETKMKVPAGWFMEKAGFKGYKKGNLGIYEKHALVIINNGEATYGELEGFKNEITDKIFGLYGVELRSEPEFIS
jgi:UDP-N-acetylmuramate dehydrogenase